jgi:hypothetical protein
MQPATKLYVIGRKDNVLLVDFSKRPEPPAPRFPGATGLRAAGCDELTGDLAPSSPQRRQSACH